MTDAATPQPTLDHPGGRRARAPLGGWLRPGPPRVVAAVLLLVAVVVSLVGTAFGMTQTAASAGGLTTLVLFVLPALATVASGVAVAVFVLTGSLAARVLGSVVAVGHLVTLLGPAVLGGLPLGPAVLLYGALAAVHLGTVVALAVPSRTRD